MCHAAHSGQRHYTTLTTNTRRRHQTGTPIRSSRGPPVAVPLSSFGSGACEFNGNTNAVRSRKSAHLVHCTVTVTVDSRAWRPRHHIGRKPRRCGELWKDCRGRCDTPHCPASLTSKEWLRTPPCFRLDWTGLVSTAVACAASTHTHGSATVNSVAVLQQYYTGQFSQGLTDAHSTWYAGITTAHPLTPLLRSR